MKPLLRLTSSQDEPEFHFLLVNLVEVANSKRQLLNGQLAQVAG
jgi:hypothetical protein